jgi:hypothetical protein
VVREICERRKRLWIRVAPPVRRTGIAVPPVSVFFAVVDGGGCGGGDFGESTRSVIVLASV